MPRKTKASQRKYGKASQYAVEKELKLYKKGKAFSGTKKTLVKSRKQAIAIGLSKARKKGAKVPAKALYATKRRSLKKSSMF